MRRQSKQGQFGGDVCGYGLRNHRCSASRKSLESKNLRSAISRVKRRPSERRLSMGLEVDSETKMTDIEYLNLKNRNLDLQPI